MDLPEHGANQEKKDAVRHADDRDGEGEIGEIFQWHGDEEEQEKGNSFDQRHATEEEDRVTLHGDSERQPTI